MQNPGKKFFPGFLIANGELRMENDCNGQPFAIPIERGVK
jgi:hypothetical protein